MALQKRHVLKDKLPSKQIIHLYISMPFSNIFYVNYHFPLFCAIIVIPAIAADAGSFHGD
jgi:hypothetical protein